MVKELNEKVSDGIRARFKNAATKKSFEPGNVVAGRAYVHAYVDYIHYAEGIHAAAAKDSEHHKTEAAAHAESDDHVTTARDAHQH